MRGLVLVGAACLLAACSILSPTAGPSRFYVLTPVATSGAEAPNAPGPALGIGPVTIPGYLQRPELVTRVAPNEMQPADGDRWAEPLREQFERTLGQNLSTLLGTERVLSFPWWRGVPLDFVVQVDVVRFEREAGQDVHLVARWLVAPLPLLPRTVSASDGWSLPPQAAQNLAPDGTVALQLGHCTCGY